MDNIYDTHYRMKSVLLILCWTILSFSELWAQGLTRQYQRLLIDPEGYVVYRTTAPITIDGIPDEAAWASAPVIDNFRDISGEGFPLPLYHTAARILWDDQYLYVSAVLEEPNVWAYITRHDQIIYEEPDFEIFIDPDNDAQNYYEMEANALGTLFDLFLTRPYFTSVGTYINFGWDAPGVKVATHVNGTLNDASDTDQGWSIEWAIPYRAISNIFDTLITAGSYWHLGFSRVEWQTQQTNGITSRKRTDTDSLVPEYNWTWPATGKINMHMPERWNYLYFSDKAAGTDTFHYPADHNLEKLLWAIYYAQYKQYDSTGRFFQKLKQLKLSTEDLALLPPGAKITMEATTRKFEVTITKADGSTISVDECHFLKRRTLDIDH